MLRIGKVTDVNEDSKKVRVVFPDSALVSDWLPVVQRGEEEGFMPEIDDVVLCAYGEGFGSDGYVLGVTS